MSGEMKCDVCSGENKQPWSAPNEIWNQVVGSPNGILCPNCFLRLATHKGVDAIWRLAPDNFVMNVQNTAERIRAAGHYECDVAAHDEGEFYDWAVQVEALQQQLAGAREDQARYLWLRDVANTAKMNDPIVVIGWYKPERKFIYGDELDAAIDATLQRDRQP